MKASAAVESRATRNLQETCCEVRRDVAERIESVKSDQLNSVAKAVATANSLSEKLDETRNAAQQDSTELRETIHNKLSQTQELICRRLQEQNDLLNRQLTVKLGGYTDALLALAEATEDRHAETDIRLADLERHVSENVAASLALLEGRVADELGPLSVRLTEIINECTSYETRLTLQKIDIQELHKAVIDLDDADGLALLEGRLDVLQDELAELAAELSLTAAVTEATATPRVNAI
jgi:hypothetical protein